MAEEVKVVLRRCEHLGFGFSLLGATGPPHVIYDIVEHSPAAECRMVEAGDVILKVNGTDVNQYTTKEVLKCLRLSEDMVTLDLRRDPMLKAKIKEQLAKNCNPHYSQVEIPFASTYNSSEVTLSPTYSTDATNTTKRNTLTTDQDKLINNRSGNTTPTTGMRYKSLKRLPSHRSQKEPHINSPSDSATAEQQSDNGKPIPLRPSRIPTVQKSAHNSNLVMSQHSRFQSSQIPTKITTAISSYVTATSSALANSNAMTSVTTSSKRSPHFQHSHSLSCSAGIQERTQKKYEMEAISGPSQSAKTPRFEAYMMTGDLIINLSRTPQSNSLLTCSTKKIDSLRDSPIKVTTRMNNALAPRASEESSPTSSSSLESPTRKTDKHSENSEQYSKQIQKQKIHEKNNIHSSNNLCDVNKDYLDKVYEKANQQKRQNPGDVLVDKYGNDESLHSNGSSDEKSLKNVTDNSNTNVDHKRMKSKNCVESSSTSNTICSDACGNANTSQDEFSFSAPNSPVSLSAPLLDKDTANSRSSSPDTLSITIDATGNPTAHRTEGVPRRHNGLVRKCDSAGFRTSKSEDHLQQLQREGIVAVLPIDIDEDVNSSLNTLLDTRQDLDGKQGLNLDRIVWTYNAPIQSHQQPNDQMQQRKHLYFATVLSSNNEKSNSSQTPQSSLSSSPSNTGDSSASPTSVSSSVMSSSGSKNALGNCENGDTNEWNTHIDSFNIQQTQQWNHQTIMKNIKDAQPSNEGGGSGINNLVHNSGGDQSISEAISNISSPDYQEDNNLLSSRDLLGGMTLSDPSDSDSTILVSDTAMCRHQQQIFHHKDTQSQFKHQEHKLVIKVRGNGNNCNKNSQHNSIRSGSDVPSSSDCKNLENELRIATECQTAIDTENCAGESSPPVSEDGSDVESLHSYHYSPKGVDMPSAIRLAKRLYSLDGFKKSDVSRHLSKK